MAKIIINNKQKDMITKYLLENTNILSERKELIQEGAMDWILGAALILGSAMGNNSMATGHNREVANKAISSTQSMQQIKSALEDETKLKQLVDAFEKLGLPNPETTLAKNAEKFVSKYNEVAKNKSMSYHLDYKSVDNLMSLDTKLKQGYALKNSEMKDSSVETHTTITIKDTVDIKFDANNFFSSGGFELTQQGIDSIIRVITEIKENNGEIISVNITSSTDAETINKNNPKLVSFINSYDPTGNIELANQRSKSLLTIIQPLIKNATITHNEIPNNGSDVVSTEVFKSARTPEERTSLEAKTAKFRFANLNITAVFTNETDVKTAPEVISDYRFKLVKIIEDIGSKNKVKTSTKFKKVKYTCKKPKNSGSFDCYTH